MELLLLLQFPCPITPKLSALRKKENHYHAIHPVFLQTCARFSYEGSSRLCPLMREQKPTLLPLQIIKDEPIGAAYHCIGR